MRIDVLGVGFDNITKEEAVNEAMSLIESDGTHYVVTPNPEIVEICRERGDVARAVNAADLVLPDGIGVIKGAKILGTPLRERVPGIEFAGALTARLAEAGYSVYLLGGQPGVAVQAAKNLARQYPGLRCAGFRNGYFSDDAPVVEEIVKSKADVVFVCLGAPKQELWMFQNGAETGAKLLCGLGGSLDVFAGTARRAPKFFCDHGLEWFYRLCKEPWRWKRMMKLPVFLLHVRQEKKKNRSRAPAEPLKIKIPPAYEQALAEQLDEEGEAGAEEAVTDGLPLAGVEIAEEAPAPQEEPSADTPPAQDVARREDASPLQTQSTEEPMSDYNNNQDTAWKNAQNAEAKPERRRRRKKNGTGFLRVIAYLFFVMLVSVILASVGWELASDLCAFNRGRITEHTVEVAPGDNLDDVVSKLHNAGLVKYPFFFKLFADFTHAESKIGAGTYTLNTDMDYRALVVGMRNTSANLTTSEVKVTIPEGYTVRDICRLLAEKGVATEEELLDAARYAAFDFDFIDNDSEDISRLEGYLFPDTYNFYKPENPQRALNRLLSNFARKISAWEDMLAESEQRGYSLKKIVTIASLIEKETDGSDQGRIASVIYNRLDGSGSRAGTYGLLQIDASLLYGIPDHKGPITSADLEYSSPYNLYQNAGLPPTAIANPGAQALYAAIAPEETDYYYYALAKDNQHRFFTNYSEFSRFLASSEYVGN